ncbi:MAG: phage Gp37/Gp68 family protein [bacterium]|nr:phage Gp37/Gp68 family protein [bacterium]
MPTGIEYLDETWNVVTGCTEVSEGCRNCWARNRAASLAVNPKTRDRYEGVAEFDAKRRPRWLSVKCHPDRLDDPSHWRKPRIIGVSFMGEMFHPEVPEAFIADVFDIVEACPQHQFLFLTKQAGRMHRVLMNPRAQTMPLHFSEKTGEPLPNAWLGVTVENQKAAEERMLFLLDTPAAVHWVSYEPALGPVDFTSISIIEADSIGSMSPAVSLDALRGHVRGPDDMIAKLDLVIAGGESGHYARPMHPRWARDSRDQCQAAGTCFYFKQHGEWIEVDDSAHGRAWNRYLRSGPEFPNTGYFDDAGRFWALRSPRDAIRMLKVGKKQASRMLDGRIWDQLPEVAG